MAFKITKEDVEELMRKHYQDDYPTERRMQNAINRRWAEYEAVINTPMVDNMVIKIEWKKSRMWGYNPHAEVWVEYVGGTHEYFKGYTVSGCGYDKRIAVLESILNDLAKQNILQYDLEEMETGINRAVCKPSTKGYLPYYSMGSGFGDFLNFKSEHYAWGETFDEIHITFKNVKDSKN